MDLLEIMRQRRSVRSYTSEDVSEENIRKILEAGLLSATAARKKDASWRTRRNISPRNTSSSHTGISTPRHAICIGSDAA